MTNPSRPLGPCQVCGLLTGADDQVCAACRLVAAAQYRGTDRQQLRDAKKGALRRPQRRRERR